MYHLKEMRWQNWRWHFSPQFGAQAAELHHHSFEKFPEMGQIYWRNPKTDKQKWVFFSSPCTNTFDTVLDKIPLNLTLPCLCLHHLWLEGAVSEPPKFFEKKGLGWLKSQAVFNDQFKCQFSKKQCICCLKQVRPSYCKACVWCVKQSVSCHSKQGCHSHQLFWACKFNF